MSDTPVATLSWPARLGRLLVLVLLAGVALSCISCCASR